MAAAANGVKMEEDFKIKQDPEDVSVDMADIDVYEDDGELIMPQGTPRGMLLRIPNEVWQVISEHQTDDDFQVGRIKVWKQPNGTEKFRFELNESLPKTKMIPKQYDMMSLPQQTKGTFIFSEKDLEGFKPRQPGRNVVGAAQDPLKAVDTKMGGPVKVEKPRQKYRVIPKRTAVIGGVSHEYSCSPRDNEEFRAIRTKKEAAEKAKHSTLTLFSGEAANALHTESMGIGGTADAYIRTAVEKKKRTQENKATRMDEIPLIDIIVNLFKEYRFYSMATLRQKTNQPEAWLRQIMSKIGVLVKTGPAANHWMMNETYNDITQFDKQGGLKSENLENIKQEHIAPVTAEALALEKEEDMDDDDDDDDEEFEDVS